jgi:hypothetical protein
VVVGLAVGSTNRSPYEALLGAAFAALHPQVQRGHLPPLRAEGTLDVEHGRGWLARRIVSLMKLPAAGRDQPVRLDLADDGSELLWTRCIGSSHLRTRQHTSGSRLVERSGLGCIFFNLRAENGALFYRQSSFSIAGVPVPSPLSPRVDAMVSAAGEGWRVVVTVEWRGRFVCRYAGTIRAV